MEGSVQVVGPGSRYMKWRVAFCNSKCRAHVVIHALLLVRTAKSTCSPGCAAGGIKRNFFRLFVDSKATEYTVYKTYFHQVDTCQLSLITRHSLYA